MNKIIESVLASLIAVGLLLLMAITASCMVVVEGARVVIDWVGNKAGCKRGG